jgi:hypothetical protein
MGGSLNRYVEKIILGTGGAFCLLALSGCGTTSSTASSPADSDTANRSNLVELGKECYDRVAQLEWVSSCTGSFDYTMTVERVPGKVVADFVFRENCAVWHPREKIQLQKSLGYTLSMESKSEAGAFPCSCARHVRLTLEERFVDPAHCTSSRADEENAPLAPGTPIFVVIDGAVVVQGEVP